MMNGQNKKIAQPTIPLRDNSKEPDERLTAKEVAAMFNINLNTLNSWRRMRSYDKRYPRYHKLFTGKVYYIRTEIQADIEAMEIPNPDRCMRF